MPAITNDTVHKYLLKAALPVLLRDRYLVKGDWGCSKCACISFDCDTDEDMNATPSVLCRLRNSGILTSFAVVGNLAIKHPDVVRQIICGGHEVINHTVTHPKQFDNLQDADVKREIGEFQMLMSEEFGYRPKGFRAPHLMRRYNQAMFDSLRRNNLYDSSYVGDGASMINGALELALTACPDHPQVCFDYWHHFQLPLVRSSLKRFLELWECLIQKQRLINVFLDPGITSETFLNNMIGRASHDFTFFRLEEIAGLVCGDDNRSDRCKNT
jgi:hypothetical protein